MWGFRAKIRKMLVRIANREDPDLTASALFVEAFICRQLVFEILERTSKSLDTPADISNSNECTYI